MERAGYTVPGLVCTNSKREITTYLRIFYDFIFSVSSLIIQENEPSHYFIWWMQFDFSSSMQLPHLALVCCCIPGWWTYTPSFTLSSLMIEMFQKPIFFPFADGIWVSGDGHQVQEFKRHVCWGSAVSIWLGSSGWTARDPNDHHGAYSHRIGSLCRASFLLQPKRLHLEIWLFGKKKKKGRPLTSPKALNMSRFIIQPNHCS